MANTSTPVVFVHGLWLHASSWQPWIDFFRQAGYEATAPGWPGEPDSVADARARPESVAGNGIGAVTAHYAAIIDRLETKPILIGHSFGGTIVQKLLGQNLGAAAVAIDPAPIKGVLQLPVSSLRTAFPVVKNPANIHRAVLLSRAHFRYVVGNAISEAESAALYDQWAIPSPGKPFFQAATATFSPRAETAVATSNAERGPLLLTAGGKDHAVPASVTRATYKRYRHSPAKTEVIEFPDRGHSLTIDSRWQGVADAALGWLQANGL